MTVVLLLAVAVGWIASIVVCFLKGKPWFAVAGIASVVPLFAIVGMPMAAIGAIRLAKPGSTWAMSYLGWKQ